MSAIQIHGLVILVLSCASCVRDTNLPTRDLDRSIQTDQLAYDLIGSDDRKSVALGFSFTNHSDYVIDAFLGCNNEIHAKLEVQRSGEWITAWRSSDHGCPNFLHMNPGETVVDTITVFALRSGIPRFEVDSIDGVYRMVWVGPVTYRRAAGSDLVDSLPTASRTSNRFLLRVK